MAGGTFTFGTANATNSFNHDGETPVSSGGAGTIAYSNIATPATGSLVQSADGRYLVYIMAVSINMKAASSPGTPIRATYVLDGMGTYGFQGFEDTYYGFPQGVASLTTASTTTGLLELNGRPVYESPETFPLSIYHTGTANISRTSTGQSGATGVYTTDETDSGGGINGTLVAGAGNSTMRLAGTYTYNTAPTAPRSFTATTSTTTSGAVNVSWLTPSDTGGIDTYLGFSGIRSYKVYARTGSPGSYNYELKLLIEAEYNNEANIPTSGVITGLTPSQSYTFVVRASNHVTEFYGAESVDSNAVTVTAPGVAATPTSFTATASTTTSARVDLAWTGGATNGKLFGYEVLVSKISDGSSTTYTVGENFITSRSSATTTRTVTTALPHGFSTGNIVNVSGMSDSRYNGSSVTITVVNSTRFSYTATGSFTEATVANSSGQVRPTTRTRSSSGLRRTVVLGSNHGLSIGDRVTVSNMASSTYNGTYVLVTGTTGATLVYDIVETSLTESSTADTGGFAVSNKFAATGLIKRSQYAFSVRPKNEFTTTSGLASTATTAVNVYAPGPPSPPTGLKLDDLSSGRVVLSWTAPTDLNGAGTLTGFALFRDGKTLSTTISASTLTYTDSTVSSGTTYVYTVKARGSVADGFSPDTANSLGTATVTIATPGVVTRAGHGLATGQVVYLTTTGALPTGLTASEPYFVIYVDANTFRLATTLANAQAGTAINTSGTQSGVHTLYTASYSDATAGLSVSATGIPPTVGEATTGVVIATASTTVAGKVDISWPATPVPLTLTVYAVTYTVYDSSEAVLGTVSSTSFSVSGLGTSQTSFKVKANNIWGSSASFSTSNLVTPLGSSVQTMFGSTVVNVSNRDSYNVTDKAMTRVSDTEFTYLVADAGGVFGNQSAVSVGSGLGTISDVESRDLSGTYTLFTTPQTPNSFTYGDPVSGKLVGPNIASSSGANIIVINNTNTELSGLKSAYGTLVDQALTFPTTLGNIAEVSTVGTVTNLVNPAFDSDLTTILSATDTEITYATVYPTTLDPVTAYGTITNLTNRDVFNSKVVTGVVATFASSVYTRTLTIAGSHSYAVGNIVTISGLGPKYDGVQTITAVSSAGGVYTLSYASSIAFTEAARDVLSGSVTNLVVDTIPNYRSLTYRTTGSGSVPYSGDIGSPYGTVRRTISAANLRVRYRSGWYG